MINDDKIDIVVLWVDGSDPEWIKEFNKWANEAKKPGIDVREERFRDYGLLRYWFRGIENFAPWVNKVHFVTCGQKPDWLDINNSKLHWVKHSDYIPSEYLPIFSANPLEIMMHKIPGLTESFIFFNDDMFITAPTKKSFFFENGIPCDYAGFKTLETGGSRIPHIILNDLLEINKNFTKKQVLKKYWYKFFNIKNGKGVLKTFFTLPFKKIDGILIRHHAQPYTKSTFEKVWSKCPDILNSTMTHRFRNTLEDVNQWLFRFWNLCEGNFIPKSCFKKQSFFKIGEMLDSDIRDIKKMKYNVICIDDDLDETNCIDSETRMKKLIDAFNTILPNKSSFELY